MKEMEVENKRKSELFTMLMSPDEKKNAEDLAKKCNLSMAALVRQLLAQAKAEPVIGYDAKL
jgi:Trp operon repressor